MGRACQWLLLSRLMPLAIVLRILKILRTIATRDLNGLLFRWSCSSLPMTISPMITSSPSRVCAARESPFFFINVRQWLNRHIKPTNWEVESPKPSRCSYLIWLCSSGYCITKTAWQGVRPTRATEVQNKSPFVEITGKLLIVVLQSGSSAGKKKNWTQPRRFLLRRAYDARIVKIKMRRMRGRKVEIGWGAGTVVVEGGGFN